MIKKICDLNLDMFSKYTTHTEYVLVQGDIGANEFVINLQYKKEPMNLSNTTTTITFRKSDGNKVKGTPDIINVTQGVLRYEVGEQEVACAGKVEATVEVYDSFGSRLTSGVFSFEVREQFDDGTAIESTTEYPFLAHLMSAGANELERKEAESLRVSSEQTRESNEASRNSAEATRVSQENTRVSQENTRKTSETARTSAESTRVSQENTRKTQETSRVNAEASRVTAETGRATAESTRATQESNRVTAESGRATAESTRVSQENTRKSNETARQSAETARSTAETARQTAETTRGDQEDVRETNEATRVANEATRVSQESTRQTQETARVNAEGDSTKGRVKAENLRVTAESGRVTAENTRVSQENTRKSQETARVNAESARASAESARVTAETGRSDAEAVRVTNEDARKTAETARVSAESSRATAETARASAESTRVSQENTRKSNETARQSAETTRQTQETARQTNTTSAINRLDDAVESTILVWKPAVATYSSIATTYPSPQLGWRVETNDTKKVYRYDGSTWVHVSDGGLGYEAENTANKGVANGYAPLDASNKVPSTHLPPLNYIPTSQKGTASGVAPLDASSKVPLANLPPLNYIPTSEKGAVNGVASLGADGKVPSTQLPPLDYAGSTHTHTGSEITDLGNLAFLSTNGTTRFLRGDGIWALPANTTYSEIEEADILTGTGTTLRTITSRRLKYFADNVKVASAINADTVNGLTVLTSVPAGAKFTDTVYTHPTSDGNKHVPATGTTNNGKVLKAGATAGSFSWADDNDTITTINGKTGAITKADIVALGIPAQDTVYSHPATHPASIITQDASNRFVTDTEKATWNAKGSSNLALGETLDTAYRGDRGKIAYDHSQQAHAPSNANYYVHPSTHPASIIVEDASHRFVTDTEKSTWNAKQNALGSGTTSQYLRGDGTWATPPNTTYGVATTSANGLMSSTDKSKLDGIASGANNYSHPASHPATMITEDASHRFVTDTEKSTWNNKADKASTLSGYGIADGVTYSEYLYLSNLVQEGYMPLTGNTMDGNINFKNSLDGVTWTMNTDYASIYFKNNSDADADSYLGFETGDNGNESFKWLQRSGTTTTVHMQLNQGSLTIGGQLTSNGTLYTSNMAHTLTTPHGNIQIGPMNTGHAHIYTDRPNFYFNKEILINGTAVSKDGHTHAYIPTSASCNKNWNWSGQGGQPTWLWGGNDATNMYVYNPSNFSVAYAGNAGKLGGMSYSASATASTIVQRDGSGYIYCTYINSNRGLENTSAQGYIYDNGDGWMRKKALSNVQGEIVTNGAVKNAIAGGVYVNQGFYLYTSPASGRHFVFGNYITGSKGTEQVMMPDTSGGWTALGTSANGFWKGYSYSWTTLSDKNIKDEILPFSHEESYDMLKTLKFYSYKYQKLDDDGVNTNWKHTLGVVAQDAPYEITSYGYDGSPDNAIDLYSYSTLLGSALQAVQVKLEEQIEKNQTLEQRLNELEALVSTLL